MSAAADYAEEIRRSLRARNGEELCQRFAAARVAICGLGGLGSNVAIALARSGVGTLHLIDFDRVDVSNLNRQQYAVGQIGQYKTDALRDILAQIAPQCRVLTDCVRLTEENLSLLDDDRLVCECLDNPCAKAMLVNAAVQRQDRIIVAASGMAGLHDAGLIRTRRLGRQLYLCGDGVSDVADDGTLFASRVMLCAAHQANMILRIIAGKEGQDIGR